MRPRVQSLKYTGYSFNKGIKLPKTCSIIRRVVFNYLFWSMVPNRVSVITLSYSGYSNSFLWICTGKKFQSWIEIYFKFSSEQNKNRRIGCSSKSS